MKKIFGLLAVFVAILIIGCGGGGGGSSTGSTNGITSGDDGSTGLNTGIYGTVLDTAGQGVQGVTVRFYNNGGTQVGQASTNASGQFAAELPTTAKQFTLDLSSSPTASNYFNQFTFGPNDYLANNTSCLAKAPAFSSGEAVSIGNPLTLTLRWMGPPPPPTGCLNG